MAAMECENHWCGSFFGGECAAYNTEDDPLPKRCDALRRYREAKAAEERFCKCGMGHMRNMAWRYCPQCGGKLSTLINPAPKKCPLWSLSKMGKMCKAGNPTDCAEGPCDYAYYANANPVKE